MAGHGGGVAGPEKPPPGRPPSLLVLLVLPWRRELRHGPARPEFSLYVASNGGSGLPSSDRRPPERQSSGSACVICCGHTAMLLFLIGTAQVYASSGLLRLDRSGRCLPARPMALILVGLLTRHGLFCVRSVAAAHPCRVARRRVSAMLSGWLWTGRRPARLVRATTLVEPLAPWCWGSDASACFGVGLALIETRCQTECWPGARSRQMGLGGAGARCGRSNAPQPWSWPKASSFC